MRQTASIILASASPRRQEILLQIGVVVKQVSVDVDEIPLQGEDPASFVIRLAEAKAQAGWNMTAGSDGLPVLGADTAVVTGGQILGKPRDRDDALSMLSALSGKKHEVYTGVALKQGSQQQSTLNCTRVWFREISHSECESYWLTGEPVDKAGAYGIQGVAAIFIEKIEGSFSSVMGLPVYESARLLAAFGVDVLKLRQT